MHYIYIYMCVCVCVCISNLLWLKTMCVCVGVCVCVRARAHLKFVMVEGNAYINFEYDIPQRDGLYKKKDTKCSN